MSDHAWPWRAHGNYDPLEASVESGYTETMESLTVQSQKDEADINFIMRQYGVTGGAPQVPVMPTYGDFETDVTDYASALRVLRDADAAFASLPASIRSRFDNNPALMMAFLEDPKTTKEDLVKVGFAEERTKTEVIVPADPPVVPPAAK